jgi:amidase
VSDDLRTGPAGDPWGAFTAGPRVTRSGAPNGPLRGCTFAVKDVFDVEGHVTGAGSPAWASAHGPAVATAPAVRRLLEAGASLVGTTRLDELAWDLYGENPHEGTPVNPAAPDRLPGGSSSGSAVAVAAGLADLALGTDSGCSVRLPAAACGLFGIRPTHGRVPLEGVFPVSPRLDVVGWMARDPRLLRDAGRVLCDPGPPAPRFGRAAIVRDAFDLATPAVRDALAPLVRVVAALVGASDEVLVGGRDGAPALEAFWPVVAAVQAREMWRAHGAWLATARVGSKALRPEAFAAVASASPAEDAAAFARFEALAARVRRVAGEGRVLVLPTTADLVPRRGSPRDSRRPFARGTLALASVAGVAGLPEVTLPAARVDGCPVGLSLVGPHGSDEALLDLAGRAAPAVEPARGARSGAGDVPGVLGGGHEVGEPP